MKKIYIIMFSLLFCLFLTSCVSLNKQDKHEHSYSETYECDDQYHWRACTNTTSVCSEPIIDKALHNFDDGVMQDELTNDGKVIIKYTCKDCKFIKNDFIAHKHNYELKYDETNHWRECTSNKGLCDKKLIEINKHNFDEIKLKPNSSNIYIFTCKDCGYSKEVNEHTHNYDIKHFDDTYHWFECSNKDGYCHDNITSKTVHNYNNGIIIQQPVNGQNGIKRFTCKDCGYRKEEIFIHKHNYDIKHFDDTYHWFECSNTDSHCDNKFSERTLHNYNEGIITQQPSNGQNGTKEYTCNDCGYVHYEVLYAINKDTDFTNIPSDVLTKEEWFNAFPSGNYTVYMPAEKQTILIDNDKVNRYTDTYYLYQSINKDGSITISTNNNYFDESYVYEHSIILPSDPTYNQLYDEINQDIQFETIYLKVKENFDKFKYDDINKCYVLNEDIKINETWILRKNSYYLKFVNKKLAYEIEVYPELGFQQIIFDIGNTKINYDLKNLHIHNYVKEDTTNNHKCGNYICSCGSTYNVKHDMQLINSDMLTLDSPQGYEHYKCKECDYKEDRPIHFKMKENSDFLNFRGSNDFNVYYPSINTTLKIKDMNTLDETIINRESDCKIQVIKDNISKNYFKHYYNKSIAIYDDNSYISYFEDNKEYNIINDEFQTYNNIDDLYYFNWEKHKFIYNYDKKCFELDGINTIKQRDPLSNEIIEYTKFDLKFMNIENTLIPIYIECMGNGKHYQMYFYNYNDIYITDPKCHINHNYVDFVRDDHEHLKMCNVKDLRCPQELMTNMRTYELINDIKPIGENYGEKTYKCSICNLTLKRKYKAPLSMDTNFEKLHSEMYESDIKGLPYSYKAKITNINTNNVFNFDKSYLSYNYSMKRISYNINNVNYYEHYDHIKSNVIYDNGTERLDFNNINDIDKDFSKSMKILKEFECYKKFVTQFEDFYNIKNYLQYDYEHGKYILDRYSNFTISTLEGNKTLSNLELKIYDKRVVYVNFKYMNDQNIEEHYKIEFIYD